MTYFQHGRRALGLLLVLVAVVEFAAVVWVLAVAPFAVQLGPLPIMARSASKPFLTGVLAASAGVWLLQPVHTSASRSLVTVGQWTACVAVMIGMVPLIAPFFRPDFLIGHDGGVHQTNAFFFHRALQQGQLPVRWVEGITPGLGQPLFNFYQVGFYYLVALIHQSGPRLSQAVKLAIAAMWVTGPAFTFLLCRPLGVLPAALGAAVFAWSPYLMLDAYVRTAYPEFTAIAMVPGVLWSMDRVLRTGRPIYGAALALTTALLLISHLPAAVIVVPVAAACLIVSMRRDRPSRRRLALVATAALLGTGLAAFYVGPAILELREVQISRLTTAYFDYQQHFVKPAWWFDWSWNYGASGVGAADQLSMQIGIIQWAVLALAAVALAVPAVRHRVAPPPLLPLSGWLAVAAAAMLMMTAASAPLWARIPALAYVQFPWRFLMVPVLACAVLAAALLAAVPHRGTQALIVLSVLTLQWYITRDYREMAWTRDRAAITIDDPTWPATESARKWAFRESGYDPVSITRQESRVLPPERWTVVQGEAEVIKVAESDIRLQLRVHSSAPVRLAINSPFFPGWRVSLDGQPASPVVQADSGYMELPLPAGDHLVDAAFERNGVRAAAETVTSVSLIVWVLLLGWGVRQLREK